MIHLFLLHGQMHSLFCFHETVIIVTRSRKGFEMVQNGARSPTRLMVELQRLGRPQVLVRVLVSETNPSSAEPVGRFRSNTLGKPIVPVITLSIPDAIRGHFLLFAEYRFDFMRVQVFHGTLVRQSNECSAFDRLRQLAGSVRGVLGVFDGVLRRTEPPKGVLGGSILHKRYNLLAAAGIQVNGGGMQIKASIRLLYFNDGAARDGVLRVVAIVFR
jgi:hypothetical protein